MKILIVSGFLGAGKTTFIKALARNSGRDFVVLENEYGQKGIDGALLETAEGGMNIWELTEGCICCSMKSDFAASILTISNSLDPEYLVVEPTGVGMLSSIIANLRQVEYERISLLRPVTVLDGHSYERYINEFPELYRDQISAAGLVLFSKLERAEPEELSALRKKILAINPRAEIPAGHYSQMDGDWWAGILNTMYDGSVCQSPAAAEAPDLDNLALSGVSLPSEAQLIYFLEDLIRGEYGDIFRAKGFLPAGGQNLRFDVADGRYQISGMDDMPEARVVFIGRELERQRLRKMLLPITKLRVRAARK